MNRPFIEVYQGFFILRLDSGDKTFCLTLATSLEMRTPFIKVGMFCTHPEWKICRSTILV